MGASFPTGADVDGRWSTNNAYRIENEAVCLLPYVGFLGADDSTCVHLFLQLDWAVNGNPVTAQSVGAASRALGKLNEQHLLHVDVSFGKWLYEDLCAPRLCISGAAAIVEWHYTTTLNGADQVGNLAATSIEFSNFWNYVSLSSLAAGLHLEFGTRMNMSVSGAVPVRAAPFRSFDAALLTQLTYRY